MRIGLVKETKPAERRVGQTAAGAAVLTGDGHDILVETGAGLGAGIADVDYEASGAKITSREEAWCSVDLVVKVKEPIAAEYSYLQSDTALFTYLHLAADRPLTQALLATGTTAIAYETVEDDQGALTLLRPMSEIAGRLAAHAAGHYLPFRGPGILLGGSPGVSQFGSTVQVLQSDPQTIRAELARADVVIGAVLVPGAAAPKLVSRDDLALMKPDALLIDVAIDQGGCFATSKPTAYDAPTYEVDGITHYCVANMPGGAPHTSTRALTNATLPYLRRLAGHGVQAAMDIDPGLAKGLNTSGGQITHAGVAAAMV